MPTAYRDLAPSARTLVIIGVPVLLLLGLRAQTAPAADETLWVRALLTFGAALSYVLGRLSLHGTTGRVRSVRHWITVALGLWLLGELIRTLEVVSGLNATVGPSHMPFVGVLVCAGLAYVAALRGRLRPREELSVYLDGGIVFFATAAGLITLFGQTASTTAQGVIDLAYAIFFLATTGATLVLDLAVRAERRLDGAYVVLIGLTVLGAGFIARLVGGPTTSINDAGPPAQLLATGVVIVALGTVTWTDVMDRDPRYLRLAARLRSAMPLVALGLTPILMAAHVVRDLSGPIGLMNLVAIGLVLVTVAIRQSVLLRDREIAVAREQELRRELASAELRYRSLVERQPGAVYVAEAGPEGRWHYVSPQIESMLGYRPEEWTSDPGLWARSIHPADRERVLADDAAAIEPGAATRFEYRMLTRDGATVWVLDDVRLTRSPEGQPMLQGLLLDITPAKLTEEALRASEEQQRMIIETASYAYVAIDEGGSVVEWNRQAEETFGWSRTEAMGAELAQLIIPLERRAAHREGMRRYAATGESIILSRRIELEAVHRDGRHFPVETTIWPVRTGESVRFNALIDDISNRKELESQLRHQALHDSLTGLANRALFADRVQHALDRTTRRREPEVAVLFVDLDDFKTVNDSLGHSAGDELLVAVARRLEHSLRPVDTAARLGGDEFAILLEDGGPEGPEAVAARLLDAFRRPIVLHDKQIQIQASIGIAMDGPMTSSPEELLRNADLAMYVAKQRGKARFELYAERMHQDLVRKLDLKANLERAIGEGELALHYQPVVQLDDGALIGFEALLRWRDADGQFVPLSEVIPLAEETGLIMPIGRFVLNEACRRARSWSGPDGTVIHVAVNVSAVQLEQGSIARDVRTALRTSGLDPSALVIEITESALIENSLLAMRELRQLQKLGVSLALDDFGTGYSSLGRLRHLPFNTVKIDRSFVMNVTNQREGAVVQSILELAATMGLEVVAEGVETAAQLRALRARGCRLGQGFHFSPPVPIEAVDPILAGGRLPLPRSRPRSAMARGA